MLRADPPLRALLSDLGRFVRCCPVPANTSDLRNPQLVTVREHAVRGRPRKHGCPDPRFVIARPVAPSPRTIGNTSL